MAKSVVRIEHYKSDFTNIENRLAHIFKAGDRVMTMMESYGKKGVEALKDKTPRDTGLTAESWTYKIVSNERGIGLLWINNNTAQQNYVLKRGYTDASRGKRGDVRSYDVPIVIFLHYGHGTRNGGYVPPNSFITDAINPIFKEISEDIRLKAILGKGGGWSYERGNYR